MTWYRTKSWSSVYSNWYNTKNNYSSNTSYKNTSWSSTPKQQVFRCEVSGLKPLTTHTFYFDNVDRNQDCKPDYTGTNWNQSSKPSAILGAPLISDAQGKLNFDFFFTPTTADEIDALKQGNYDFIGNKVFTISASGSYATALVRFKADTFYK